MSEGFTGPTPDRMLPMFKFKDVDLDTKAKVQTVRDSYEQFATTIVNTIPPSAERTVALRKLLESKDCAVRGLLFQG